MTEEYTCKPRSAHCHDVTDSALAHVCVVLMLLLRCIVITMCCRDNVGCHDHLNRPRDGGEHEVGGSVKGKGERWSDAVRLRLCITMATELPEGLLLTKSRDYAPWGGVTGVRESVHVRQCNRA